MSPCCRKKAPTCLLLIYFYFIFTLTLKDALRFKKGNNTATHFSSNCSTISRQTLQTPTGTQKKKKSQLKVRFLACSGDLSFVTQSSAANSRVARSIETLSKLQ